MLPGLYGPLVPSGVGYDRTSGEIDDATAISKGIKPLYRLSRDKRGIRCDIRRTVRPCPDLVETEGIGTDRIGYGCHTRIARVSHRRITGLHGNPLGRSCSSTCCRSCRWRRLLLKAAHRLIVFPVIAAGFIVAATRSKDVPNSLALAAAAFATAIIDVEG